MADPRVGAGPQNREQWSACFSPTQTKPMLTDCALQDNTDAQYFNFRKNLPYLALLLVLHPLCRKIWNAVYRPLPVAKTTIDTAEARLEQRTSFDYFFALVFLAALHGFSMIKVLAILYINYQLATGLPRKYVPVATWTFNVAILFANELCDGYMYKDLAAVLSGASPHLIRTSPVDNSLVSWGAWMDSWGGIMSRWEILFNITVLRLISFNLDYYWSLNYRSASPIEVAPALPSFRRELRNVRR